MKWITAIVLLLLASPAWGGIDSIGTLPSRVVGNAHAEHVVTMPNGGMVGLGGTEDAEVDPNGSIMSTTWVSPFGTHKVETPRLQNESNSNQAKRHKQAVLALQAEFPPSH